MVLDLPPFYSCLEPGLHRLASSSNFHSVTNQSTSNACVNLTNDSVLEPNSAAVVLWKPIPAQLLRFNLRFQLLSIEY